MKTSSSLQRAARRGALVLLYHSVGDDLCAAAVAPGLHHVGLADFERQLEQVARCFEFVPLDALLSPGSVRARAALCFDDGHRNVFEQALPVAAARAIPVTCFVNGACLEGDMLWREKLRHLLSLGLEQDVARAITGLANPGNKAFYRYSKHPANDSRAVERALDAFLRERNIALPESAMLRDPRPFASHPLISWGNHAHRHYVMSSLDDAAQWHEIEATANTLRQHRLRTSALFALPFGGAADGNRATFAAAAGLGMRGIAFSRNRLHTGAVDKPSGLAVVERVMPRGADIARCLAPE